MIQLFSLSPEQLAILKAQLNDPGYVSNNLFMTVRLPLTVVGFVAAVRVLFRVSILRSMAILALAGIISFPLSAILYPLFGHIMGSPFLLVFAFLLLRGYFNEIVSTQRARAAFKQNLEAATINPRDSSAHYNLGLIHQQRGEQQARERFQRAIDIDPDELMRTINWVTLRAQGRPAETIGHFEEARDQSHHRMKWRGSKPPHRFTQYADARRYRGFTIARENDPGDFIRWCARGLGDVRSDGSMQACIEVVKTAPAQIPGRKRWLNEGSKVSQGKRQETVNWAALMSGGKDYLIWHLRFEIC
jgi:tetratricopeptide (TPR) repeat protein